MSIAIGTDEKSYDIYDDEVHENVLREAYGDASASTRSIEKLSRTTSYEKDRY